MRALGQARSFLFVPADSERKIASALRSQADAVILDLEDGVAPERKSLARDRVHALMPDVNGPRCLVRIAAGEPLDLEAIDGVPLDGVVLAKASLTAIDELPASIPDVVALIEDARALRDIFEIAAREMVVALMLGTLDLAAELGLRERRDGAELLAARSALVFASSAAGIRRPVDGVHTNVEVTEELCAKIELARDLGFGGKACIHPKHLDVIHAGFGVPVDEVDHAREVVRAFLAASSKADGVTTVGGKLVDRPVYLQALGLLEEAGEETPGR